MDDFLGGILEWFESGNQDVCKKQQTFRTWVVLVEAAKDFLCQYLTEESAT